MKALGKAPPSGIHFEVDCDGNEYNRDCCECAEHYRTAILEAAEELEKLTVCDASHGLFVLTPFVKRLRISAGEVED